ncbi:hypothetical protein QBC35DRAFT_129878 [Podospora australis]|uniref:Secreted protein n=1 Tax=Podospora australis TaxID=1536484 RepID=A0AAN6WY34_9PEZI|nr:hypothetical protein QBC35DRAFT_129878 [Podospora australis]
MWLVSLDDLLVLCIFPTLGCRRLENVRRPFTSTQATDQTSSFPFENWLPSPGFSMESQSSPAQFVHQRHTQGTYV